MSKDFFRYYTSFFGGFLFRWVDKQKIKIIKEEFSIYKNNSLILDLGSGTGNLSYILKKIGKRVICIDIEKECLMICKEKGLEIMERNLEKNLPFKNNSVDGILFSDVIEHLNNPKKIISEIKRCLKNKGKLILFTPAYDSINWIIAEKIHNYLTKRKSGHISPFTYESLDYLLSKYFTNIKIKKINFGLTLYALCIK